MNVKSYGIFGIIGLLVAYGAIGVSIALSPWFRWDQNALSDLGHAINSGVAPIFNFGLLLAGFSIMIYAVTSLRSYARWTSYNLVNSSFMLQLIAVFDEVYGFLHQIVSILFFFFLIFSSIIYTLEKKSYLAAGGSIIGFLVWVFYWAGLYSAGIAIPEIISSVVVLPWIISAILKSR